jgi:hypothetical protein
MVRASASAAAVAVDEDEAAAPFLGATGFASPNADGAAGAALA